MKQFKIILFLFVGVLAYFPLFHELSDWPIQIFDESRTALNSLEMSQNGNYIVTYVNQQPDMWNTKPPLFFWIQSTSIKIFGLNAFALRIPSAIFGCLTGLLLFWFSFKYLKNYWIGLLSVMVLVTFQGYIRAHVTRTGDFDATLVFFTTVQVVAFYLYLLKKQSKYLTIFFIALTLAALTKGIAALFFAPVLFFYLLKDKMLISTLKKPTTYVGIFMFLFLVVGYYFLREHYNEGYLKAAFANDMGGRFNVPQEGNGGNWGYYFNAAELLYWMYFIIPAFLLPLFAKDKSRNKLINYITFLTVFYFIVISSAQTKLPWYLAQLYPLLSISIACFLFEIVSFLYHKITFKNKAIRNTAIAFTAIIIFVYPYYYTIKNVTQGEESKRDNPRYALTYFIKDYIETQKIDISNFIYLNDRYNPHVDFELAALNYKGANISFGQKNNLFAGDKVVLWQNDVFSYIEKHYNFSEIFEENGVFLLEIK